MNITRYVRFALVGAVAAAVHFFVAVAFVSAAGWPPQAANVAGYCVALLVSYLGQSRWTFDQPGVSAIHVTKFVTTSLGGFALNAITYAALLRWTHLDYRVALLLVLVFVAVVTFLTLSNWVFGTSRPRAT